MGKIKKITDKNLLGESYRGDIYPITAIKAVYDEKSEGLNHILDRNTIVNISTNYNSEHIAEVLTKEECIAKVPEENRVLGFQGKYLSSNGWYSISFIGDKISDWNNIGKWTTLPLDIEAESDKMNEAIDSKANTVDVQFAIKDLEKKIGDRTIIEGNVTNNPDEEDISTRNIDGKEVLSFNNRSYNPLLFSGKGYKILRKNIQLGGTKNVLTSDMVNEPNTIYEIRYDFDLNGKHINIPEECILIFQGGSLSNGELSGNNTYIAAPLYHIFKNITLHGSFSNAEGNVEWFGAKAYSKPITYDCAPYINAAFDSPFGTIVFQNGCYYLASTILLKRVKTILMKGQGSRRIDTSISTNAYPVNNHTCLWVNSNINIFEINLNGDDFIRDRHDNTRLVIKGGCLNASMASEQGNKVYNKTGLLIKLPVWGMINSEICTSMVRSAYFNGTLDNTSVDDRGNGVWFTDNGKLINAEDANRKGADFVQNITVDCIGFTHGVLVDYNSAYGNMTQLMIHGYFDSCVKDICINSNAITYGLIDATIQSGGIFKKGEDVNKYPHISGNLNRCKIDSVFWDLNNEYHSPIAIDATKTTSLVLGDRARSTLGNNNIIGGGAFYYALYQNAIHPLLDTNKLGFINANNRDNYLKLIDNSLFDVAKRKTVKIDTDSNLTVLNKNNLDASALFSDSMLINLGSPESSENAYLNLKITFSTVEQISGLYLHVNFSNSVTHFNNVSIEAYNEANMILSSNYDSALKNSDNLPGLSDFIIPVSIEGFYAKRQVKYIIIKMKGLVVSGGLNYVKLSLEGGAQGSHSHMITSLGGTVYGDLNLENLLLQGNRVNYDSNKSSLTIGNTSFISENPLNRQFLQKTSTEGTSFIKLFSVPRQFLGTFIVTISANMYNTACYIITVFKGFNSLPTYAIKELYKNSTSDFVTFKSTNPVANGDNRLIVSTGSNTIVSRVYVADYLNSYYTFGDLEFIDANTWNSLPNTIKVSKYVTLNVTATGNRPASADIGTQYFDTTLNKPIWWNGSMWVDSDGTALQ